MLMVSSHMTCAYLARALIWSLWNRAFGRDAQTLEGYVQFLQRTTRATRSSGYYKGIPILVISFLISMQEDAFHDTVKGVQVDAIDYMASAPHFNANHDA